jgi:hypothetical protein
LEARGGIEPPMKVLQTFALPLGDRASVAQPLLAVLISQRSLLSSAFYTCFVGRSFSRNNKGRPTWALALK